MELDTEIAVSVAKMKVDNNSRSKSSISTTPPDTNVLNKKQTGTESFIPNVESFLPLSSCVSSQHPPASYSQTRATQEDLMHFPTRSVQQSQYTVQSNTRQTHSALPSTSHDNAHVQGPRVQGAHGSSSHDGLEG